MNLLQVIHERWAADGTLNGLLDSANVYTGNAPDAALPFCVVERGSQEPEWQSNCQTAADRVGIRFQLFHENRDDGYAIAEGIKAFFNRSNFSLSGSDVVQTMERAGDFEIQDPDGVWRFVIDFQCLIYLSAGV